MYYNTDAFTPGLLAMPPPLFRPQGPPPLAGAGQGAGLTPGTGAGRRREGGFAKLAHSCSLLRTSLTYQTRQFFENSTLHGVRYIREDGRPFCEKFMWFCFTAIGGVATLIIISSLWEKFQTNPTITGLDTDFHNWDVPFPAVSLCLLSPANDTLIQEYVDEKGGTPEDVEFLKHVTNFSLGDIPSFATLLAKTTQVVKERPLKEFQEKFAVPCSELLMKCEVRNQGVSCCDVFSPMPTEVGYCFVYNSRLAARKGAFEVVYIRETDEKWALVLTVAKPDGKASPIEVYIQSNDEAPILDVSPQHEWTYQLSKLSFSAKQTYTTEDARQLSIKQRRCVFPDEIKLETDTIYTYTSCMTQCRLRLVRQLCGCAPFFYTTVKDNQKVCGADDMDCLVKNIESVLRESRNCRCELGCMNTVYEVEKMEDGPRQSSQSIEMSFVSWPIVRYKREVLFGWVDLLVSFGGIAGLFLGFSLLSGVEIIYYFTMRACCMMMRDADELQRLQHDLDTAPKPPLDLSLTPYFLEKAGEGGGSGLARVKPLAEEPWKMGGTLEGNMRGPMGQFPPRHNVLRRPYAFEFLP